MNFRYFNDTYVVFNIEKKKDRNKSAHSQEVVEEKAEKEPANKGEWLTTMPSGERFLTRLDGTQLPVKDALVCSASDPMTRQVRNVHITYVHLQKIIFCKCTLLKFCIFNNNALFYRKCTQGRIMWSRYLTQMELLLLKHSDGTRITTYFRELNMASAHSQETGG